MTGTRLFLAALPAPVAAQCDPDGEVQFVCGPADPEDLAAVPESPWVIVSSMANPGQLYATDSRDHSSRPIFPLDDIREPEPWRLAG